MGLPHPRLPPEPQSEDCPGREVGVSGTMVLVVAFKRGVVAEQLPTWNLFPVAALYSHTDVVPSLSFRVSSCSSCCGTGDCRPDTVLLEDSILLTVVDALLVRSSSDLKVGTT